MTSRYCTIASLNSPVGRKRVIPIYCTYNVLYSTRCNPVYIPNDMPYSEASSTLGNWISEQQEKL